MDEPSPLDRQCGARPSRCCAWLVGSQSVAIWSVERYGEKVARADVRCCRLWPLRRRRARSCHRRSSRCTLGAVAAVQLFSVSHQQVSLGCHRCSLTPKIRTVGCDHDTCTDMQLLSSQSVDEHSDHLRLSDAACALRATHTSTPEPLQ